MLRKGIKENIETVSKISLLTSEERDSYKNAILLKKKAINEELSLLNKDLEKIEQEEREINRRDNEERLQLIRENKDFLLKIVAPKHSRSDCNDSYLRNDYLDNGYPVCKRCMLIAVLNNERDYKINFDINFSEI